MTDQYSRKMESYRCAAREEGFRTHKLNQEAAAVQSYIKAVMGNMWPDNYKRWRSRFVDNRLAKARFDHLSLITDLRPIIQVTTSVESCEKTAEVITRMIEANWKRQSIDMDVVTVADITDFYGTGFWRLGAAKPGMMSVTPCGPDQVMPIQPGFNIQESTAVAYRTWKSIQWLKNKFPYSAAGIEREITNQPMYGTSGGSADLSFNRPNTIDQITWNGLSQGMKRALGVRGTPTQESVIGQYFKTLEVEEYFVDDPTTNDSRNNVIISDPFLPFDAHNWWYNVSPTKRLYPRKRHMVFAGSRLLSDGPSPYWHGLYPFATLRFNPVFWSFWGMSRYRNLMPVNTAINEIVAGALDLVKRALNPTAITKQNALSDTAWKEFFPDLPGMKLKMNSTMALSDAVSYVSPPDIPAYVFNLLTGFLVPEFDRLAGSIDINEITGKKQIAGADSIDMMRDSQNTGLRLEERCMEVFLRESGTQVISNELQFSTAEYRLKVLGEEGLTPQDFNREMGSLLPEDREAQPDYWRQFAMTVNAGSLHSGAKDRDKQMAVSLAGRHLYPIKEMYRKIGEKNPDALWDELIAESQQAQGAPGQGAGQQGKQPTSLG